MFHFLQNTNLRLSLRRPAALGGEGVGFRSGGLLHAAGHDLCGCARVADLSAHRPGGPRDLIGPSVSDRQYLA